MTVAFDAKSTGNGNFVTSVTFTHTPVGTPSAVGITVYGYDQSHATWTNTYGGTAVPIVYGPTQDAGTDTGYIAGLVSPSSGAQTVVVSTAGIYAYPIIFVATVTGSDTTTCFSAGNISIGSSTALSTTVSGGTSGELVFCLGGIDGSSADMTAGGAGTNTTSLYLNTVLGGERASSSTAPGASLVTATYTASATTSWLMAAASFKQAAGGVTSGTGNAAGVGAASAVSQLPPGTGVGNAAGVGAASAVAVVPFAFTAAANNNAQTAQTTVSCTLPVAVVAGDVVMVAAFGGTPTTPISLTLSNSSGDTYTDSGLGAVVSGTVLYRLGAFLHPTTGVTTFTATQSPASNVIEIYAWKVSGFVGTPTIDKAVHATFSGLNADSGPSGTLTVAKEAAIGYIGFNNAASVAGSGWSTGGTNINDGISTFGDIGEHQITSSTTAIHATATGSGTGEGGDAYLLTIYDAGAVTSAVGNAAGTGAASADSTGTSIAVPPVPTLIHSNRVMMRGPKNRFNAALLAAPIPVVTISAQGVAAGTGAASAVSTSLGFISITTSPSSGTVGLGSTITFTVHFDTIVTVSNTPQLFLNTGGTATYQSGSGTSTLTYTYTVASTDTSQTNLAVIGSNPYYTNFRNVENPLSESGAWQKLNTGNANLQTISGPPARVIGSQSGTGGFNDSFGHLLGYPPTASVNLAATIYRDPALGDPSGSHEVELHVRATDTSTENFSYECNVSHVGAYYQVVSWHGSSGWTYIDNPTGDNRTPLTGDVYKVSVTGSPPSITTYLNYSGSDHLKNQVINESTYNFSGQPGIGMWLDTTYGAVAGNSVYGFTDFLSSASGAALSASSQPVPTIGITQTFTGLAVTTAAQGLAAGIGGATAVGTAIQIAAGAASGIGAASSVGAALDSSQGVAAGTGAASAQVGSQGLSAGTGAASAAGTGINLASGIATGTGAASAVGVALATAQGIAAGFGSASAATSQLSQGVAAGTGAANAVGVSQAVSQGVAAGTGALLAKSQSIGNAAGIGAASAQTAEQGLATGTGSVNAIGVALAISQGLAAGIGALTATSGSASKGVAGGIGSATAVGTGIYTAAGAAAGTSTASAVGASLFIAQGVAAGIGALQARSQSIGAAAGIGSVNAIGFSLAVAQGVSAGVGAAAATSGAASTGIAAGTGAAAAIGTGINTGIGTSAGTGTLVTVGTGIATAVGNSTGTSSASAVGASLFVAQGIAAGIGQVQAFSGSVSTGVAAGIGAAAATGFSFARSQGAASGIGTGNAAATVTLTSKGVASGTGAALAINGSITSAVGQGAGTGHAAAVSLAYATGISSGISSVLGIGAAHAIMIGSSAGIGKATSVGLFTVPFDLIKTYHVTGQSEDIQLVGRRSAIPNWDAQL